MPEGDAAAGGALSPGEFGTAFKAFLEQSTAQAPKPEPVLTGRLRRHLGADPATLPIVSEDYEPAEHPDLQVALDAWVQEPGRSSEAVGWPTTGASAPSGSATWWGRGAGP